MHLIFPVFISILCVGFICALSLVLRKYLSDPACDRTLIEQGAEVIKSGKLYKFYSGQINFTVRITSAFTAADIASALLLRSYFRPEGKIGISVQAVAPAMSRFTIKRLILCALPSEIASDFQMRFRFEDTNLQSLMQNNEFVQHIKKLCSLNLSGIEHNGQEVIFKSEESELKLIKETLTEIAAFCSYLESFAKAHQSQTHKRGPNKFLYLAMLIWWVSLLLIMWNIGQPVGYPWLLGLLFVGSLVGAAKSMNDYDNYRFVTSDNVIVPIIISSCL